MFDVGFYSMWTKFPCLIFAVTLLPMKLLQIVVYSMFTIALMCCTIVVIHFYFLIAGT